MIEKVTLEQLVRARRPLHRSPGHSHIDGITLAIDGETFTLTDQTEYADEAAKRYGKMLLSARALGQAAAKAMMSANKSDSSSSD